MRAFMIIISLLLCTPAYSQIIQAPVAELHTAVSIAAGCTVRNIDIKGDYANISSYVATYDAACTPEQIAAGNAVIAGFNLSAWLAAHPPRKLFIPGAKP